MSYLKGTVNYIWTTSSKLGHGATGFVYQGVHKVTGSPVAVKAFNQVPHPDHLLSREFETLKIVNHENIVKLLAIEEEQSSHSKVIIMEMCSGGSLFTILDDPENHYGIEEDEFLTVLSHLASGMNHLRERKLIHRDLKPGNIMKCISVDGRSTYKLVDFGAARRLDDDQQFMSLYGTEEYLHPDMYERAVLRKDIQKKFDATVDLWSIGVTLYHVATGALPFRPYGGRRNRDTMHSITTEKKSGIISGVQTSDKGPIVWNSELPNSCQISLGLKSFITPLLAGLLECDQTKMWGFSKFFSKVRELDSKVIVHVVYVDEMIPLRIFLDPNFSLEDLQNELKKQTGIEPSKQFLMFNDDTFDEISLTTDISALLQTSLDNQLILIGPRKSSLKIDDKISYSLLVKFPDFSSHGYAVENDAALGKISCSVAYTVLRHIEKVVMVHKSLLKVPEYLKNITSNKISSLKAKMANLMKLFTTLDSRLKILATLHRSIVQLMYLACQNEESDEDIFIKRIDEILKERIDFMDMFRKNLKDTKRKVEDLERDVVQEKKLENEWKKYITNVNTDISRCPNKASTYTKAIRESWQYLLRDKLSRSLDFNQEQFHNLEKVKIQESSKKEMNVLQNECMAACNDVSKCIEKWHRIAYSYYEKQKILSREVDGLKEDANSHEIDLNKTELEYKQQVEMILSMIKNKHSMQSQPFQNVNLGNTIESKTSNLLCSCNSFSDNRLKELANAHSEIKLTLDDHKKMIQEFEELTVFLMEANEADNDN